MTEDQYANALMHDPNLVFSIKLHKAPIRHRKISANYGAFANGQSKLLACSVMDLMVEFIRSHLMKRVSYYTPWPLSWGSLLEAIARLEFEDGLRTGVLLGGCWYSSGSWT